MNLHQRESCSSKTYAKSSMENVQIKTWIQGLDYTSKTRKAWRNGEGRKTAHINANHFTRLRGESFPLERINNQVMSQVVIELEEEGYSNNTINHIISAVSTVINHCLLHDVVDLPKRPQFQRCETSETRPQFYSKEQVHEMEAIARTLFCRDDLADIIMVAAYTGMRQGELFKLRVEDVDFDRGEIHVGGVPRFQTKARNYRCIPLHDEIRNTLWSRCKDVHGRVKLFDEWSNKEQLLRAFHKVRRHIGLPEGYVFHTLRHSFATWCVEAAVPFRTIMDLMGHKNIETTLRYAKVSDRARNDAIAAI